MPKTFTVCFFGHRTIQDPIPLEARLESLIASVLTEHPYVEFLVGRDGEFDLLVSSVIHRYKRLVRGDNCSLVWVMPYETAEFHNNRENFYAYYDEIEVAEQGGYYKSAFQNRNRWMLRRADLAVFYVNRRGGAEQTYRYALRNQIPCINLGEPEEKVR